MHVRQEDGALDDVVERRPVAFEDRADVLEGARRLGGDVPGFELERAGEVSDLSRQEEKVAGAHRFGEGERPQRRLGRREELGSGRRGPGASATAESDGEGEGGDRGTLHRADLR